GSPRTTTQVTPGRGALAGANRPTGGQAAQPGQVGGEPGQAPPGVKSGPREHAAEQPDTDGGGGAADGGRGLARGQRGGGDAAPPRAEGGGGAGAETPRRDSYNPLTRANRAHPQNRR